MPEKRPPRDSNQLAKFILDVTRYEEKMRAAKEEPSRAGFEQLGGQKAEIARSAKLQYRKRKSIAKKPHRPLG